MVNNSLLNPGTYKGTYKLIGGSLCLDFSNTISFRNKTNPHEWLDSIENLISWCEITETLNKSQIGFLHKELLQKDEKTKANWSFLREFREVIYKTFSAIAESKNPSKKDISFINEIAKQKCSWQELQIKDNQIQISPSQELSAYEHLIYKIYNSTIETLTQFQAKRIKKCSACQWLFYDTSKNSSRKWCVMEDCGNRDKVNRFNKRKLDKGK